MLPKYSPEAFSEWCRQRTEERPWQDPVLRAKVDETIRSVKQDGDKALLQFTEQWDGVDLQSVGGIEVSRAELIDTAQAVSPEVMQAIKLMVDRLRRAHAAQRTADAWTEDGMGNQVGLLRRPLARVGIYAPGGRAAYPSSVLMGLIPAAIAGVQEKWVVTPPGADGRLAPAVAAACLEGGADRVFRVGGAQAIAALAFGTETIPAVDMVVGPGNAYVTCAKALLQDQIGIDGLAGPSEICIVADESAQPEWVAADLLAQAEHDPQASSVLITTSAELLAQVENELAERLDKTPRKDIAKIALEERSAAVLADTVDDALYLAECMAPEHLSLQVEDPEASLNRVRRAGAVFVGGVTPVAAGDYAIGSNHVLPTGGTARFASGLNLEKFLRKIPVVVARAGGEPAWADASITLADAEGLPAHAESLRLRLPERESQE